MTRPPEKPGHGEADLKTDPLLGQLKAMYDDVVAEPLPDDLLKLLDQLDEAERNR